MVSTRRGGRAPSRATSTTKPTIPRPATDSTPTPTPTRGSGAKKRRSNARTETTRKMRENVNDRKDDADGANADVDARARRKSAKASTSPRARKDGAMSRTNRWMRVAVGVLAAVGCFYAGARYGAETRRRAAHAVVDDTGREVINAETARRALLRATDGNVGFVDYFVEDLTRGRSTTKAPVALLAATNAGRFAEARAALEAETRDDACAMLLDCANASLRDVDEDEARGMLQWRLARHFERCPRDATVILHDVAAMDPRHVRALLPALSEDGSYVYGGKSIKTTHGVFVITAHLPAMATSQSTPDEREFTRVAKNALVDALSSRETDRDATILALRRRIDAAAILA